MNYEKETLIFKALSDSNRLQIINMLSCGELCACKILEKFNITQPTLSHHMKTLCDCKLVRARKDGKWTYYSLNEEKVSDFRAFLAEVTSHKDNCICCEAICDESCTCEEESA